MAIITKDAKYLPRAQALSRKLGIPFFDEKTQKRFFLCVDERLSLEVNDGEKAGSLSIDYSSGAINFRRLSGKQLLLKAVGGSGKNVLDSTAGLGRDAFILASFGCKVRAIEKSPIIGELVLDALARCQSDERLKKISGRLEFFVGESLGFIKTLAVNSFDTLYIDPMYPEKKKTALPKKEMIVLQKFFGTEPEEVNLQEIFEEGAKKFRRIVVKRPIKGPELFPGVKVKFRGSTTRFDVYVFEN